MIQLNIRSPESESDKKIPHRLRLLVLLGIQLRFHPKTSDSLRLRLRLRLPCCQHSLEDALLGFTWSKTSPCKTETPLGYFRKLNRLILVEDYRDYQLKRFSISLLVDDSSSSKSVFLSLRGPGNFL